MASQMDYIQEKNDRYLKDYEEIYELTKMSRDIDKKINDTDNIKAKQVLLDMQNEINAAMADGVAMSEYDLKYLQAKYDLRLAEIALEEAQNAKSQVMLTRDADGNYSYTYTADENKIADAQ
jgi:hypothetical protein